MPCHHVRHRLALAALFSWGLTLPGSAQEAGVLPPLFGVAAAWDAPPGAWVEAFGPVGWTARPGRAGSMTTDLNGAWLGHDGVLTIYPSDTAGTVRSFAFEASVEGRDSAAVRALFLSLVDTLSARLGPPSGWGLGGLYKQERVLAVGILEAVWRQAGTSGDYLTLEARSGKLKVAVRSAAYQSALQAQSRAARLRWEAEETKDGPIVSPNHVYEPWEVKSPAMLSGCVQKPPRTGYRGQLTITAVVAPWGRLWPLVSLETLDAPRAVRRALEDWINQECGFVGGMIDGTFVYSRLTFTVSIDR